MRKPAAMAAQGICWNIYPKGTRPCRNYKLEHRLDSGGIPNFGDIQKLVKTSKKIYRILEKNNLIEQDKVTIGKN